LHRFCGWVAVGYAIDVSGLRDLPVAPGSKAIFQGALRSIQAEPRENGSLGESGTLPIKPCRKSAFASMARLALEDSAAASFEPGLIPLADTSIVAPMRPQPASSQALSLG